MKSVKFNNLFWKISSLFFLLLLITGICYIYITIHFSSQYSEDVNQRLHKNTAKDIASHTMPFTEGKVNHTTMERLFNSLMDVNPSLEFYLLDTNGNILSYYAPDTLIQIKKLDLEPLKTFISADGNAFIKGDDPRHPGIRKVFSAAPVISNGTTLGYIYVVLAGQEFDAVSKSLSNNYIINVGARTILFTLLVTLFTGMIIIRLITRNFDKIISVMKRFREGDTDARVKMDSTGDVRQLADLFNEMADILNMQIEKVKSVEKLRRELIANVSHDLRTPIAVIHGYAETVLQKYHNMSDEERTSAIQRIEDNTTRLQKLVNELFELSRLESGQTQPVFENVYLSDLINDLIMSFRDRALKSDIIFNINIPEDIPAVRTDLSMIDRVLQNLIDNAIKYNSQPGEVFIQLSKSNSGTVRVEVGDRGAGISDEEQSKIFNRFYRVASADGAAGTGLGLSIVARIIDILKSSIRVQHREGGGTLFVFELPVAYNS